ncbi:MAG: HAMP domain-containing histidine kinase [Bacteroidales bacterium]|nr:HAMP domain-containing histidine kinase [Bacteroidales bacterium]
MTRINFQKLLNFSVEPGWSDDHKSEYRKLNGIMATMAIVAFSSMLFPSIFSNRSIFLLQAVFFSLYMLGFVIIRSKKLQLAKRYLVIVFETHMFVGSILSFSYIDSLFRVSYSPAFIIYILFPVLAAALRLNILRHAAIALGQIAFFQLVMLAGFDSWFESIPASQRDAFNVVVAVYTILMTASLVSLLAIENTTLRRLQIERNLQLKETILQLQNKKSLVEEKSKELAKVIKTKDRLFAIISHDLNSPFNAILGLSTLMQKRLKKSGKQDEFVEQRHESAFSAHALLTNLLDWANSQFNEASFQPKFLQIFQLIKECISAYDAQVKEKKLRLEIDVAEDLLVYADGNMLSAIIRNLLNNAIKFSNENGIITISARLVNRLAQISIKDNGEGIDKKTLENLFVFDKKPYKPGTAHKRGKGLGMMICKDFVDNHQGNISVDSRIGEYTIFTVTLPQPDLD